MDKPSTLARRSGLMPGKRLAALRRQQTAYIPGGLERLGLRYWRWLYRHQLRRSGRRVAVTMNRNRKNAITMAGLAGLGSALAAGYTEYLLQDWPMLDRLLVVTAVGAAGSGLELVALFFITIQAGWRQAALLGASPDDAVHGTELKETAASLVVRAALELPDPPYQLLGHAPRRITMRHGLFYTILLYKLRVAGTNFLLKRLLALVAPQWYLLSCFVVVPVTVLWNYDMMRTMLRETNVRIAGFLSAKQFVQQLEPALAQPATAHLLLRTMATVLYTSPRPHPNVAMLLSMAHDTAGLPALEAPASREVLVQQLRQARPQPRGLAARVLAFCIALDGKVSQGEREIIQGIFDGEETQEVMRYTSGLAASLRSGHRAVVFEQAEEAEGKAARY